MLYFFKNICIRHIIQKLTLSEGGTYSIFTDTSFKVVLHKTDYFWLKIYIKVKNGDIFAEHQL